MKIQAFDYSINVLRALLWRHNEAENLQAIIQNKQDALDELNQDFWVNWYDDVFNIQTANAFGLSVWAIILDLSLTIDPELPLSNNSNFGFGSLRKNFNNGNYTNSVNSIILTTDQARLILKLRYYQLVTRGTVPECNKIVADVFSNISEAYVLDGNDMTMTYVFLSSLPSSIRFVLNKYDLLPRPSGVKSRYIEIPNSSFGFGSFRKNFNNGNFG